MPNILLTGVSTLDIINYLDSYPAEDSEVRASQQILRSGGNATNTSIVIQQLGIQPYLLALRADDATATQLFAQLDEYHINTNFCPVQPNSTTPTSYITLNTTNGSRTIVHYRNLNELDADSFCALTLGDFDWLHFEARNCEQLSTMLDFASFSGKPISIELEKDRQGIDELLHHATLLLISKPFAEARDFGSATECLEHFSQLFPDTIISCTWGDQGAWAYDTSAIIHQAAFGVDTIVETLGAGDTFNAGFIACLMKNKSVELSLQYACQLAATKCQQSGLLNLTIPS